MSQPPLISPSNATNSANDRKRIYKGMASKSTYHSTDYSAKPQNGFRGLNDQSLMLITSSNKQSTAGESGRSDPVMKHMQIISSQIGS